MSYHPELAEKHSKQSYEESANWSNYQALLLIDNVKGVPPPTEGERWRKGWVLKLP